MRLRRTFISLCASACAALVMSACTPAGSPDDGAAPPTGTVGSSPSAPPVTTPSTPPPPPAVEPPSPVVDYRVSYDWRVPSNLVTINHPLAIPIAAPPAPPLPYLVGVYVGNHPSATPAFQRISFYFRGAFPSYNFRYVSQVTGEGTGTPLTLAGNAFVRLGFTDAQAHDDRGSTIKQTPKNPIGFPNLRSYGLAGDFEGHVTYGLGIQVAPGSDQVLKIRTGELKKSDGAGGFFYVVHLDVQAG